MALRERVKSRTPKITAIKYLRADKIAADTYLTMVLNVFRHSINSGSLGGVNNKIKTVKRRVYGYRGWGCFKLRTTFICEAGYQLVG